MYVTVAVDNKVEDELRCSTVAVGGLLVFNKNSITG